MPLSFNPFATAGGQFYTKPRPDRPPVRNAPPKRPPRRRRGYPLPVTNEAISPWSQLPPGVTAAPVPGAPAPVTNEALGPWSQLPPGVTWAAPTPVPSPPAATFTPGAGVQPANPPPAAPVPFDYETAIATDPGFLRFLNALSAERQNQVTGAGQAITTAFGRFGGDVNRWRQMLAQAQFDQDPILGAIDWDAAARISSGATPYGATTLSQLERGHALRQAQSDAALNARGMYRSGEQGWATDQEKQEYARGIDAASSALLEMLSGVESSYLESETDRANRQAQAYIDAYNRVLEANRNVDTTPEEAPAEEPPAETPTAAETGGAIDWTAAIASVGKQPGPGETGRSARPGKRLKTPKGQARRRRGPGGGGGR